MSIGVLAAALVGIGAIMDDTRALKPVSFEHVRFIDGFWAQRLAVIREATVPHNFDLCESTGRLANIARAAEIVQATHGNPPTDPPPGGYQGYFFNDSDVYKAIEAAAYQLALAPDADLQRRVDAVVNDIARMQLPDGYVNSYYVLTGLDKRWTNEAVMHETYCMGHLIEAGVAHHHATGSRTLLDVAIRAADHMADRFGPGKRHVVPGHQEAELALIRLWRVTHDDRHLDLARFFIDERGIERPDRKPYGEYCQDHAPVRDHADALGHAVRAGYLYASVADLCAAGREPDLLAALDRVWEDITQRKMYITGGIGNSAHNEGFTRAYDLPNETAYAETCAAISLALWSHRMAMLHGDASYLDVFERALYNGALSGLSLDGRGFFYENPLASRGERTRRDWYACACCPPNIARFFSSLGGCAYAAAPGVAVVNFYAASTARIDLGGRGVALEQGTDYPWSGRVRIGVSPERSNDRFEIWLRIPAWCANPKLTINNEPADLNLDRGYARLARAWRPGDLIDLDLPLETRRVRSSPFVSGNVGRVALQRGPIVYCVEQADHPAGVRRLILPPSSELRAQRSSHPVEGAVTLHGRALLPRESGHDDDALYTIDPGYDEVDFTAIPYFAWANRQPGEMAVWLAETPGVIPPPPLPGATPAASHCWTSDSVLAICDRIDPKSSDDHSVPRLTWWNHKGSEEWVELTFDQPRAFSGVEVYWFDDGTIGGGCRIPASWRVQILSDDGSWMEVEPIGELPVAKDRFCRASFKPVVTGGLRVLAQLREGFSGGVLEVRPLR